MAISISDDGTIKIYQGDSGKLTVNGLYEPIYESVTQRKTENDETLGKLSLFVKDDNKYGVVNLSVGEKIYLYSNDAWEENSTIKSLNDEDGSIVNANDETLTAEYETVEEITNEKNFTVYFEVQDSKRNVIFEKVLTNAGEPSVTFELTADETDLLTVPTNKNYVVFYYGIKACEVGTKDEDTLFVGGKTYGNLNQMIVYPKQAEGTTKQTEVTE